MGWKARPLTRLLLASYLVINEEEVEFEGSEDIEAADIFKLMVTKSKCYYKRAFLRHCLTNTHNLAYSSLSPVKQIAAPQV